MICKVFNRISYFYQKLFMKDLALVISAYNEEGNLEPLIADILKYVPVEKNRLEIIFVNDGSTDKSGEIINSLCEKNNGFIKALHFSRNFGHEAAMIAGIDYSESRAVICIDSDLQNPAEKIADMYKEFNSGKDIVLMQRSGNSGSLLRSFFNRAFYRHLSRQNSRKYIHNVSDFFLISKRVADILKTEYRERNRFIRGYIQNMGFELSVLKYDVPVRYAGKSKYSRKKLVRYSVNSLMSNSKFPLLISWYIGVVMIIFSAVVGLYSLIMYFIDKPVSGYTTIVVLISFIAAVQFFILGIMGRYIAFIFDEIKNRPVYLVDRRVNFNL